MNVKTPRHALLSPDIMCAHLRSALSHSCTDFQLPVVENNIVAWCETVSVVPSSILYQTLAMVAWEFSNSDRLGYSPLVVGPEAPRIHVNTAQT